MKRSFLLAIPAAAILLMVFAFYFFIGEKKQDQIPKLDFYSRSDFRILDNYELQSFESGGNPWFVSLSVRVGTASYKKKPMQLQVFLPKDLDGKVRLDVKKSWLYIVDHVDQDAIRLDFSQHELGYAAGFRFWDESAERNPVKVSTMKLVIVPEDNIEIPEKYKNGLLKEDIKVQSEYLIDE